MRYSGAQSVQKSNIMDILLDLFCLLITDFPTVPLSGPGCFDEQSERKFVGAWITLFSLPLADLEAALTVVIHH